MAQTEPVQSPPPSLKALTAAAFKIGCLGFGGPAGQIALMHRIFVEEKQWVDEARYLHALNYCMLLPGPEAQQLATYIGWLLHGVRGGVIAGALFVLPGALVVTGLAWLYAVAAATPFVAAVMYGVKAAVLALVAAALVKTAQRALKTRSDLAIAFAAFAALLLFKAPFPLVILAAAGVGLARAAGRPASEAAKEATLAPRAGGALAAAAVWGVVWLAPLGAVFLALGPDHVLSRIGGLFAHLAVVTFGGAYAVLAYLQQQAVELHGWLTPAQMIDGLGLAETTPGPLVLVNLFVGFLAGWGTPGGGLGLALAGAAMAAWQTFAPSFVWIFAGAPYAEALRRNRCAAGALAAVTAAVLGVIAQLAWLFASHALFAAWTQVGLPWGGTLELPELASLDPIAAGLALAAGVALLRFKVNVLAVIAGCAAAGVFVR